MDQNVRAATPDDLPDLLRWSSRFAEWAGIDADAGDVGMVLLEAMDRQNALIALHDCGFIVGGVAPAWFNTGLRVAEEMMWWSEGNGVALLDHFEAWAAERADMIVMVHLPGNGAVLERLYRRRGYRKSDQKYMRAL